MHLLMWWCDTDRIFPGLAIGNRNHINLGRYDPFVSTYETQLGSRFGFQPRNFVFQLFDSPNDVAMVQFRHRMGLARPRSSHVAAHRLRCAGNIQ